MKALLVLLAITAQAASLTQITWTVAGVGNTPATGSAIITLSAPCTWNGVYINTAPKYANIIAGSFTVSLVPNDACLANSLPNRTYYTVIWTINGQTVNNQGSLTQTWFVPTSATALDVSSVLASPNPPTYPLQSISPMQISQFGASVGQGLCWGGLYWGPGTCSSTGVGGDWLGTWQSHAPGYFQTAISGAPGTWPTLGTASSHAAADFEPALGNPGTGGYCLQSTTLGVRSWGPCGSGGGANSLNVSDGAGGFLATPISLDPTTGLFSGPSTLPLLMQGVHLAASGVTTPATNQSALVFDSGTSDHTTRKDSSGVLHDLENTAGLNGVLKYTSGAPSAIGTSSTNCVHEDGSSGSCGGGSGAPVGSTPSISPSTGTYTSTQSATASCSRGNPFYCLGTLGSACASSATVTAYSVGVSVATSARFQAQCRDGGYDPGTIGYSDITISNLLSSPTDITNSVWTAVAVTKTSALVVTTGLNGVSGYLEQLVDVVAGTGYTVTAVVSINSPGNGGFSFGAFNTSGGNLCSASHEPSYGNAPYTLTCTFSSGINTQVYYKLSLGADGSDNLPVTLSGLSLQ